MVYDRDLAERIRELVAAEPGVTEKAMFGGLAFLIHGNMAVAASGQGGLLLRVDPARTAELVTKPEADRFVMRGKAMDGWLRVEPPKNDKKFAEWISLGVTYAKSLPPK